MLNNVVLKTLWDQRRSLLWWGIGMVAISIVTMLFYPSLSNAPELNNILSDENSLMKAFVGDIDDLTSPEGFMNSQLFFLLLPMLFMGFAVTQGSAAIAGEEEKGTLDLLMSSPISRRLVLVHKWVAMLAAIIGLVAATWIGLAVGVVAVDMDISLLKVAAATLSAGFLGMAFGSLALALGATTGRRAFSIAIGSVVGVTAYLINALTPAVEALEPARYISPFHYYSGSDPITNGLHLGHVSVLLLIATLLYALATVTFERRDLGV